MSGVRALKASTMRPAVLLAGLSSLLTFAAAQAPPGPSFNPLAPGTATVHTGAELLAALHANKGSISLAGESSSVRAGFPCAEVRSAGLQTAQVIFQDAGADQKSGSGSRCPLPSAADIYLQPTDWQTYSLPISIRAFNQTVLIHGGGCCTRAGMPCGRLGILPARPVLAPCSTYQSYRCAKSAPLMGPQPLQVASSACWTGVAPLACSMLGPTPRSRSTLSARNVRAGFNKHAK